MVECYKQGLLTGYPSRSLKDNSTEINVDYGGPTLRGFRGYNIIKWDRDHSLSWHILMAAFCSCPKNIPEAKCKSIEQI